MTEMNPDNNLPAKKDATASALTDIQQQINSITKNAALIFAAIFLFFATEFASVRKKILTKTMNIISALGAVIGLGVGVWSLYIYYNPEKIELNQYENAFGAWSLIMLAFSIVGTVHAFRTKT